MSISINWNCLLVLQSCNSVLEHQRATLGDVGLCRFIINPVCLVFWFNTTLHLTHGIGLNFFKKKKKIVVLSCEGMAYFLTCRLKYILIPCTFYVVVVLSNIVSGQKPHQADTDHFTFYFTSCSFECIKGKTLSLFFPVQY